MGSAARPGRLGGGAKAAVAAALTVVVVSLAVYLVWGEPGQVSGYLTDVARDAPGGRGL